MQGEVGPGFSVMLFQGAEDSPGRCAAIAECGSGGLICRRSRLSLWLAAELGATPAPRPPLPAPKAVPGEPLCVSARKLFFWLPEGVCCTDTPKCWKGTVLEAARSQMTIGRDGHCRPLAILARLTSRRSEAGSQGSPTAAVEDPASPYYPFPCLRLKSCSPPFVGTPSQGDNWCSYPCLRRTPRTLTPGKTS